MTLPFSAAIRDFGRSEYTQKRRTVFVGTDKKTENVKRGKGWFMVLGGGEKMD